MKYNITWEYKDSVMKWGIQIENADLWELKDFVMHGMPSLTNEFFQRLCKAMLDEPNIDKNERIWVMAMIWMMAQNELSEYLTKSMNDRLGQLDNEVTIEKDNEEDVWLWDRVQKFL